MEGRGGALRRLALAAAGRRFLLLLLDSIGRAGPPRAEIGRRIERRKREKEKERKKESKIRGEKIGLAALHSLLRSTSSSSSWRFLRLRGVLSRRQRPVVLPDRRIVESSSFIGGSIASSASSREVERERSSERRAPSSSFFVLLSLGQRSGEKKRPPPSPKK